VFLHRAFFFVFPKLWNKVSGYFTFTAVFNIEKTYYAEDYRTNKVYKKIIHSVVKTDIKITAKPKGFAIPVLNIGNPGEFTMRQLAETILELMPTCTSKMTYAPLPGDDPKRRRPDNTWAKEFLDWSPQVPLREGLVKTIGYFAACGAD
jgi:UDP-glucuronate decarboxylase